MEESKQYWQIGNDAESIEWHVHAETIPHQDHVELAGKETALVIYYGVAEDGSLIQELHCIFPMLRMVPNNTCASFQVNLEQKDLPGFRVGEKDVTEYPEQFIFNGIIKITSRTDVPGLHIQREIFPADGAPADMIHYLLQNTGTEPVYLDIRNNHGQKQDRGARGVYLVDMDLNADGKIEILPGRQKVLSLVIQARTADENKCCFDVQAEKYRRLARIAEITGPMQLETGIPVLDMAFYFCKLRAGESIFRTRGGYMHGPGGERYYAATWCNDELEYAGPWFAWTGDKLAVEASENAYKHYMPFMGPDYHQIPSSVIAEGFGYWEGAGDRGDAAMYAYGASRFMLTCGDRKKAESFWPGIEWCLEYCRRHLNGQGVVLSDSDEMENRFESGDANLCTSSLYYGALKSSAALAKEFGQTEKAKHYLSQAEELARNIEKYFGAEIHGFKTYRYYAGNTVLRSWIGIPLCMGILDRAEDTVAALYSDHLWFYDGMLCQEGESTYWDRSLLYGLRGALIAGNVEQTCKKLLFYTEHRLLGDHVPYPIEAWPEGDKRHLSAESALYCRVITEGILGLEALSFHSFRANPRIPAECQKIKLLHIRAFGREFDLIADRIQLTVSCNGIEKNYPLEAPCGCVVDLLDFSGK